MGLVEGPRDGDHHRDDETRRESVLLLNSEHHHHEQDSETSPLCCPSRRSMQPLDNLDQESPLRYDSTSLEETRALCQLWTSILLPAGRTTSALSLGKRSVVPLQGEREGRDYSDRAGPAVSCMRDGAATTTTTFRSSSGVYGEGYRYPVDCPASAPGPAGPERFLSSARRSLVTHCLHLHSTARRGRQSSSGGGSSVR